MKEDYIDPEIRRKNADKTVFVGMSGGVDSSVSALLLKQAGFNVVGVYMKNWSRDLPGMKCPWADDLADAKRVAVKLDIDFRVFDFETEYHQKVVDYMLDEFKKGNTPNPDIICNQEIKFKLFYEVAKEHGADLIATGHYASTGYNQSEKNHHSHHAGLIHILPSLEENKLLASCLVSPYQNLCKAHDQNKDQTYFLYRISEESVRSTIFPLSKIKKPEVKQIASDFLLDNAYKKESMGVCFVGEVGIRDFLKEYFEINPGEIIDYDSKKRIGMHEGAIFYTIGQRHGLNLGGGLPYYIVDKDISKNLLYASKNLNSQALWTRELNLRDIFIRHEYTSTGQKISLPQYVEVRIRHRAELQKASLKLSPDHTTAKLEFNSDFKRPASGQSAVFYHNNVCLGGGIITDYKSLTF